MKGIRATNGETRENTLVVEARVNITTTKYTKKKDNNVLQQTTHCGNLLQRKLFQRTLHNSEGIDKTQVILFNESLTFYKFMIYVVKDL
jgi:hypothetical protein